ncbi:MAG TPA: Ig-like domain-containing protein, partial [Mycobacteriales bacterium]|nr:Ig-like domain-containing protein [Mycobacteriales bacterium]
TSPFTVDSLSNATHTLELRATDGADNTSTATSYSWTVNSSLVYEPVTFASGPADPSNDTNPSFDFGVSDGNTSVTGYTCSLDSAAFTACDPTTGPVAVDLSTAADGLHSFAVIAHYGGTSSATAVYKWHLDTVAPATPSVDPVASPSQAAAVTFSDTDSDVATFTCQIDALAPVSCASPFTVTAAGTHTVAVSATDYAGNTSAPATSNSFVVKTSTTAPTFTGSADKFKTHAVSLSVQATEAGDTLSCALDSGTPVDCTGGTFEATTSDGNHTLHATATDGVGNKASSAFPFLVKTSTTAPTVASSDPATFHVHTVVLHVASTDPGDTLACSLDGAAATDCTGGVWTGTVADGVHHLTVTAKDALGNTASTVRAFTVDTSLSGGVDDPGYGNLVGSVASWTTVKAKGTYGGSYIEQRNAGASVTVAFAGPSVTWYTVTGPDQGVAKVYIDGKSHGSVNDYATKRHTKVAHTITGLKKGAHKLRIVVAGKKGAKTATDQLVSLDAVKVGKKVLSTPKVTAFWRFLTVSGVSVPTTDLAGSALAATFSGTSVTWFDLVGPTAGKVTAFVDGVNRGVFDDHAATVAATAHSVTGLSAGVHVIKLVTSPGTKKGAFVSIVAIRAK